MEILVSFSPARGGWPVPARANLHATEATPRDDARLTPGRVPTETLYIKINKCTLGIRFCSARFAGACLKSVYSYAFT